VLFDGSLTQVTCMLGFRLVTPASAMILIMAYMERRQTANVEQGALETQRSSVEEH